MILYYSLVLPHFSRLQRAASVDYHFSFYGGAPHSAPQINSITHHPRHPVSCSFYALRVSNITSRCVNYRPQALCNLHTGSYDRGHEATALHSPHQAQTRRDHNLATEPPGQRNLVEFISDLSSRLDTPRVARLKQDTHMCMHMCVMTVCC